jgi:hypothetical protein
VTQQLELFVDAAPLTKDEQRVLELLQRSRGLTFEAMRQILPMSWPKLGRAVEGLMKRRLVWHGDAALYGVVHRGGSYPERYFALEEAE